MILLQRVIPAIININKLFIEQLYILFIEQFINKGCERWNISKLEIMGTTFRRKKKWGLLGNISFTNGELEMKKSLQEKKWLRYRVLPI